MSHDLNKLDDESLMLRLLKSDHQAFSILVERHSDKFYGASYRVVLNQHDAEDVVQDAFLKIWNKPTLWKPNKSAKFTTWFYRIVTNLSIDKMRKNKGGVMSEIQDDLSSNDVSQERALVLDEQQIELNRALAELPEKQRIALNLCFYEGLSNKDAAIIMKVNIKALESLLMRAKAGMKNHMVRTGYINEGEAA